MLVAVVAGCGNGTTPGSQSATGEAAPECTSGLPSKSLGLQGGASTQAQVEVDMPGCWPSDRAFTLGANWEVVDDDSSEVLCSAKFSFDEVPAAGSAHRLNLKFSECPVSAGREVYLRTDAPDFALAKTSLVAGGDSVEPEAAQPTEAPATTPPTTAAPAAAEFDLVEVRTGEHDDFSRLVFEFGRGARPDADVNVAGSQLTVRFLEGEVGGAMNRDLKDTSRIETPVVGEAGTHWKVPVPTGVSVKDYWLDGPTRFVVDLSGPTFASAQATPEPPAQASYDLVEIRTGDEGTRNRVVFEFDGPVPPWNYADDLSETHVIFEGEIKGPASTDFKSAVIGQVGRHPIEDVWTIDGPGPDSVVDSMELSDPPRVVIDF